MQKSKSKDRGIAITSVRGVKKYCANITMPDNRRKKAYFDRIEDARLWLANMRKYLGKDLSDIANLSVNQLADIRLALSKLPAGYTLTQCVDLVNQKYISTKSLSDALIEFKSIKTTALLSQNYKEHLISRLKPIETWHDFNDVNADYILSALNNIKNNKGQKITPKTWRHYYATWRELFDWAQTRGYIKTNPFDQIHESDLPRIGITSPKYPSVETTRAFFARAEKDYPQYVGILALVAFGGFRRAEAARITLSDIDFDNKRITLSADKSKTRQNWLQDEMPDNLWAWLAKYPPNINWINFKNINNRYTKINAGKIPDNGLRHAFATYHLSLYRDAPKTSLLMRHRSPNMLWQHYLAGLVSVEVAEEYFSILPNY